MKTSIKTNTTTKKHTIKKIILTLFLLFIICCDIVVYLLYGPWHGFRDWLITTAMNTFTHQYLATIFYNDETIQECLNRNKTIQISEITDESLIDFENNYNKQNTTYKNEYERQILEKDKNNNDYKIIEIDGGNKYNGYMAVIYDPSRIEVFSESDSAPGTCKRKYLTDISKETNSLVAINAGGFNYAYQNVKIAFPLGITISNNQIISDNSYSSVIGFNKQNKLILGNFSTQEALSKGIRDCVSFEPFLIVNGKKSQILGNGGTGRSPRTAIGQRADGIVLFLVLDGNRNLGRGATIQDLIDIFDRYGAINAANLDGGSSSTMTVKDKIINDPIGNGNSNERVVPTAFILRADNSDNGDYSIVKNKVDN